MKQAKRILCLFLAAVLVQSMLTGCRKAEPNSAAEITMAADTETTELSAVATTEPDRGEARAALLIVPDITPVKETVASVDIVEEGSVIPPSSGNKADEPVSSHVHSWQDVVTKVSCTSNGYTTHTCKTCRETFKDNYVASAGHKWSEWTTIKASTTTSSGTAERRCSVCRKVESRILEILPSENHKHSYAKTVVTKPTCTNAGLNSFICNCGDKYTETVPSLIHSYEKYTINPTCTDSGYTCYSCEYCSDSYTSNETPAKGHSWSNWITVQEATVDSAGLQQRECASCRKTESQVIDKILHTHDYTSEVLLEANCVNVGSVKYSCSCGSSYIEPTPAKGHVWGDWITIHTPTTISAGLALRSCKICGTAYTKPLDKLPAGHTHSYTVMESVSATCEADGYEKKICSCGDIQTEIVFATGHTWEHKHQDEQGHTDYGLACHCGGWSFGVNGDYISSFSSHVDSVPTEDRYNHSYYSTSRWVVDSPAQGWDVCTVCGITK